ncbi:uncharacterized protein LOC100888782 [Anopheles sinensis]|uniref:Uncharacterized protein LOC100888782 n=1 Tax=Anopheles sinensis TaxID=74873 RepID=A0A084W3E9_ANOSI|nr:uncharacterized protein LOC100888782 [Anopheles sinensis]
MADSFEAGWGVDTIAGATGMVARTPLFDAMSAHHLAYANSWNQASKHGYMAMATSNDGRRRIGRLRCSACGTRGAVGGILHRHCTLEYLSK